MTCAQNSVCTPVHLTDGPGGGVERKSEWERKWVRRRSTGHRKKTHKNRKQNNHGDGIVEQRSKPQKTLTALSVDITYEILDVFLQHMNLRCIWNTHTWHNRTLLQFKKKIMLHFSKLYTPYRQKHTKCFCVIVKICV